MNQDLKIIKNKYGENMMHLCREFFPILLEKEGLLSNLLLNNFSPSHELYQDLVDNDLLIPFKNYLYSLVDVEKKEIDEIKTPQELMSEAGYNLYLCETEEDIASFKKYYAPGEQLCTFNGDRLKTNVVFFAVKKDVDKIKREDFQNPTRQDLYGTSVISIQFSKDGTNTLSIKNRYNHRVNNPDATFSNNLENIISGLTNSFEKYYGLVQLHKNNGFEIPNYVKANDGKFYKYNYEINNVYFCPNNIIIDNFKVNKYEKERYIVLDYFILDLKEKRIWLYGFGHDTFPDYLTNIQKIEVKNNPTGKTIYIKQKAKVFYGDIVQIELDKRNRIIGYKNSNLKQIGFNFLTFNETLEYLELPNVKSIGSNFLLSNKKLKNLSLPKVMNIDYAFLFYNRTLESLSLPNVRELGDFFLFYNKALKSLYLPKVRKIGIEFLYFNEMLKVLILPDVREIGYNSLHSNRVLEKLFMPNIEEVDAGFLYCNGNFKEFHGENGYTRSRVKGR